VAVTVARADRVVAMAGGLDMFVESTITATAAGRRGWGDAARGQIIGKESNWLHSKFGEQN